MEQHEKAKITVFTPVYNRADTLPRLYESLKRQTDQSFVWIIVNDGSTDESLCILEEYSKKDNRFMVLSQKNLHAGVARNNGIDHASGEYMIFLDADDLFELELLEKTYKQGIQQDADIVLFDADYFNTETGERLVQNHLLRTELLDGKEVFDQADNNEVYKKYVDEYYRTLAMGIYNLQYAYDPSMIIIGGAISSRSDLLDKVNEQLDIIFSQLTHAHVRPNIKVCQFGNDANLIGATYHYIQRH